MKGVSDNSAQKKTNSKGNKNDLKKPLQVLQLNKKESKKNKSENFSQNENLLDINSLDESQEQINSNNKTESLEKQKNQNERDLTNSFNIKQSVNKLEKPNT